MIKLIQLLASAMVIVHCICMVAKLNHRTWLGHKLDFAGYAASYAMLGGGAMGVAFNWQPGSMLLLLGISGLIFFDRRHRT